MSEKLIIANEAAVRLGFFAAVFTTMALWELAAPRRRLLLGRGARWPANLGIVVLDTALLRLLFPAAAAGAALFAADQGWGLLNYLPLPAGLEFAVAVVGLDLAIYLQHVMFHAVPVLWRLHRVHHADLDFDVTTGLRFHPLEIIISMLIKLTVIAALGPALVAVVAFEVLLNATSMFNHGNVRLPRALDRVLRLAVVTPDMHRIHHSIEEFETNSNFGFNLSLWDRLFGTYKDQPDAGHEAMTIGISTVRDNRRCATLSGMLLLPFTGRITAYVINRRSWRVFGGKDGDES